jgi:hypothetical protein
MITIAWDIDDVLNSLDKEFKNWASLTGLIIDDKNYLKYLDRFRLGYYLNLKVNTEVYNWFIENGDKVINIAITAVPNKLAYISSWWLFKNFKWFTSIVIIPSYREEDPILSPFKTKGEYLQWLKKVDVFIDNNEKNIRDVKKLNPYIKCFHVNNNIENVLKDITKLI